MTEQIVGGAIGVLGTIAGTVVGFLLSLYRDMLKAKARVKAELQTAINQVLFVNLMNDYPVAMNNLRRVIVKHVHLIRNKEIPEFYSKWLANPVLSSNLPIANMYTADQVKELRSDLLKIVL